MTWFKSKLVKSKDYQTKVSWEPTVFSVFEYLVVKHFEVFGVSWEGDPISRECVPRTHCEQLALVILAGEVLQDSRVVDKRVQHPTWNRLKASIKSVKSSLHSSSCPKRCSRTDCFMDEHVQQHIHKVCKRYGIKYVCNFIYISIYFILYRWNYHVLVIYDYNISNTNPFLTALTPSSALDWLYCRMYECMAGNALLRTTSVWPCRVVPKRNNGFTELGFCSCKRNRGFTELGFCSCKRKRSFRE